MVALAFPSDVEARLGRDFTDAENARIEFILDDVSAVVRQYTGRDFAAGTRTVRRRPTRGVIRLGERPVTSITSVHDLDGNDVSYTWDGLETLTVPGLGMINEFEINVSQSWPGPKVVDVTYVAGPQTVPDAVVAVVCQMAARALGRQPVDSGVQQETIAGYSYSVGAAGAAGAAGMMNDERAVLDKYRRVGATAYVGPR